MWYCGEDLPLVWVINRPLRWMTSLLGNFVSTAFLNDHRKAWMWGIPSELKRISFSSPLFLCLKGLTPINGVLYGAHSIPFLPYALLQSSLYPPGETWALVFRSPCHRRKLHNCQHICDSLVSTPSNNMAVKIALSVLDHLESNLIQAFCKKRPNKNKVP